MRWTEEKYLEYMASRQDSMDNPDIADKGPEAKLQGKIMTWAKDWGRPCQ